MLRGLVVSRECPAATAGGIGSVVVQCRRQSRCSSNLSDRLGLHIGSILIFIGRILDRDLLRGVDTSGSHRRLEPHPHLDLAGIGGWVLIKWRGIGAGMNRHMILGHCIGGVKTAANSTNPRQPTATITSHQAASSPAPITTSSSTKAHYPTFSMSVVELRLVLWAMSQSAQLGSAALGSC